MAMVSSDSRQEMSARLQTDYFYTTGACVQLFFWAAREIKRPIISIKVITEDKIENDVIINNNAKYIGWNRLHTTLPEGIHQIVVSGLRSSQGYSGLYVDDVIVQECSLLGKLSKYG